MCSLRAGLLIALCVFFTCSVSANGSQSGVGPAELTNKDVLEMLNAELSQEVVVAKIKSSSCKFDTSPDALKALKTAKVPDAVILAMVQAPVVSRLEATPERVLREAQVTCMSAKEIPLLSSPDILPPIGEIKCGSRISVLEEKKPWFKVRTLDGRVAYISYYFVSNEPRGPSEMGASETVAASSQPSTSRTLPPNELRAVAWRGVPWVTTSYYQQQGSASTNCTGSGTWFGNMWQGNSSCTTQYTPAQSVPINWQHYTIYNLVETSDSVMVLGCTRNWAFSKCSYLIPGNTFEFEDKKGKISIRGHKAGKDKEQTLDFDVVSSEPKTSR
jgi:SH3 domain-containing protein